MKKIDERTGIDYVDVSVISPRGVVPEVRMTVCLQDDNPILEDRRAFVFSEYVVLTHPDLNPLGVMRALHQVTGRLVASMEGQVAHGTPEIRTILTTERRMA